MCLCGLAVAQEGESPLQYIDHLNAANFRTPSIHVDGVPLSAAVASTGHVTTMNHAGSCYMSMRTRVMWADRKQTGNTIASTIGQYEYSVPSSGGRTIAYMTSTSPYHVHFFDDRPNADADSPQRCARSHCVCARSGCTPGQRDRLVDNNCRTVDVRTGRVEHLDLVQTNRRLIGACASFATSVRQPGHSHARLLVYGSTSPFFFEAHTGEDASDHMPDSVMPLDTYACPAVISSGLYLLSKSSTRHAYADMKEGFEALHWSTFSAGPDSPKFVRLSHVYTPSCEMAYVTSDSTANVLHLYAPNNVSRTVDVGGDALGDVRDAHFAFLYM